MRKIRVFLIDDDYFVRGHLTTLLSKDVRTRVVGAAATPEEALNLIAKSEAGDEPDVVLLDMKYEIGKLSGHEIIPELRRLAPEAKVLAFSMLRDDEVVLAAIRAGADGFVWKNEAADGIASAIQRVCEERFVVTKSIAQLMLGKVRELRHEAEILPDKKKYLDLTKRVEEVIRLYCICGMSAAEIAEELYISVDTVRSHIKIAYQIFCASNRREAFQRLIAREDEW
jgi:DNA-binding NarL/FixJ family response regulator